MVPRSLSTRAGERQAIGKGVAPRLRRRSLACYDRFSIRSSEELESGDAAINLVPHESENPISPNDVWMRRALAEARAAFDEAEVPIGAVIVRGERIIAAAHNQREQLKDPTAHAEMIALTQAAEALGSWRLLDCTLYVTRWNHARCARERSFRREFPPWSTARPT
jgi:deoxycytidylate deaminase